MTDTAKDPGLCIVRNPNASHHNQRTWCGRKVGERWVWADISVADDTACPRCLAAARGKSR